MKLQINKWLAALILAALLWPAPGAAQADQKPGPRQVRMQALEQMIGASGGESLERFIDEQIDPEYVRRMTRPDLVAFLQRIRKLCARAGGITAEPAGEEEAVLNFETERAVYSVRFTIAQAPPHRIVQLSITEGEAPAPAAVKELSWDRLDSQLEEAAAAGFSGTDRLHPDRFYQGSDSQARRSGPARAVGLDHQIFHRRAGR
jgi:hypothetical protein